MVLTSGSGVPTQGLADSSNSCLGVGQPSVHPAVSSVCTQYKPVSCSRL